MLVPEERVAGLVGEIFARAGVEREGAALVARHLVAADRYGAETHGVARVPLYVDKILRGEVNPNPAVSYERPSAGLLRVDGDGGLGALVVYPALEVLGEMCRRTGVAAALVSHVAHLGALRCFVGAAIAQRLALVVTQYTLPNMAPAGSGAPLIGNNPFAFGLPGGSGEPLIVDLSMSVVARGRILRAVQRGDAIPADWASDADGNATTDPKAAMRGALIPFAGHKGIALAFFAELFAGVLSGAVLAPPAGASQGAASVAPPGASSNVAAFLIAIDVEALAGAGLLDERMEAWVRLYSARAGAGAHLPGKQRMDGRLELAPDVLAELDALAARFGIAERLGVAERFG